MSGTILQRVRLAALGGLVLLGLPACTAAPRNMDAVRAYYAYDFPTARAALRAGAEAGDDEQALLDDVRLGMAALADGDAGEAERALGQAFELLSTAGLNADRTTAAVLVHEGVRIWKGEPFEQALAYHYVSTLYAVMGDWENTRAAAANSLYRLRDFGADQTPETLVRNAAGDPEYLETGYRAVDTDFALGFLMQAVGSDLSGAAGSREQFAAAVEIDPDLAPLVETLQARAYDTLLIVDYGKGPTKIAYGPDEALVRFEVQDDRRDPLVVSIAGREAARVDAVCDVNEMAVDHRWNNLEDIRRAKSAIGDALILGGTVVAANGHDGRDDRHDRRGRRDGEDRQDRRDGEDRHERNDRHERHDRHERAYRGDGRHEADGDGLLGLGLILAGLATKSGARADTRYLEFAPQSVYLVPLRLETPAELDLALAGDDRPRVVLPDVRPGEPGRPRAIYLRLHGPDSPQPRWLTSTAPVYGNDHTGVRPGDYPYVLGGLDVSTPSRKTLEAYQANGHLGDVTVSGLGGLYRAEGITLGSGAAPRSDAARNPSYRHVLEDGTGLFTPVPDSLGYKRLMYTPRPPYEPQSELARNLARRIGIPPGDREEETFR